MKLLLPALLAVAITGTSSAAAVVAFWDFNNLPPESDDSVQIVYSASQGAGTIYQQRGDIDGNGKLGNAFIDPANSISVIADKAMGWNDVGKKGANDAEFFVTFSTTGFSNVLISFDISGNSVVGSGIDRFDLKYALTALVDVTDPTDVVGTIKDFDGGNSISLLNNESIVTPTDGTFVRLTYDLSLLSANAVNNQGFVTIRFDDWQQNDDMAIDNVLITGTAIPEPSALLLASFAGLGLLRRRR